MPKGGNTMVKKISEKEFSAMEKKGNMIIDFSATWCNPCRMLAPVMEEVSDDFEGQISFFNVDVDENPSLAQEYDVQSIPALVFIKDGKLVDSHIGFEPKNGIENFVKGNLA